ncbi:YIP1 family protein [Geoglobus acetivorans]|uniref:YIP1 family protein n=1 Tax=Geoglobus acetivorans TaxID=565033 RepID=A0ABZ3H4M1_GEOAI|nr:YIP1 family protein [Geoglobus acetivorans]
MIKALTNPGRFFEEESVPKIRAALPPIIIISTIGAISQYLISSYMKPLFSGSELMQNMLAIAPVIGFISAFIVLFVLLVVIAGIIHAISSLFGGEGEFGKTMGVTAYGFYPLAIASVIQFAIQYYFLQSASPETLQEFLIAITNKNLVYSGLFINLATLVWSIAIWSNGVAKIRKIELKKAIISASIPAILYLGYTIYSIMNLQNLTQLGSMPV